MAPLVENAPWRNFSKLRHSAGARRTRYRWVVAAKTEQWILCKMSQVNVPHTCYSFKSHQVACKSKPSCRRPSRIRESSVGAGGKTLGPPVAMEQTHLNDGRMQAAHGGPAERAQQATSNDVRPSQPILARRKSNSNTSVWRGEEQEETRPHMRMQRPPESLQPSTGALSIDYGNIGPTRKKPSPSAASATMAFPRRGLDYRSTKA